jgi:NitT/TauT family transport system ATP-binding protein
MLTRVREGTPNAAGEGRPVQVSELAHSFGDLRVIGRIDLEVAPGEVVGIVGPSGCGKTTLLELLAGLRSPDAGAISVGGRSDPSERLEGCAYMPQRDLLLPWLSAVDNAALALRIAGASKAASRTEAGGHFERLGLSGFERSRPGELSGGMRQRVAFLRTLMAGRPVLLLDEPFAALDEITRQRLDEQLRELWRRWGMTVIFVTHSTAEAAFLAQRAMVLSPRPGRVVADCPIELPDHRTAELRGEAAFARQTKVLYDALGKENGLGSGVQG